MKRRRPPSNRVSGSARKLVYTTFVFTLYYFPWSFRSRKKRAKDLAQPPAIVWRDKQMNVEETPVPEAACKPTVCQRAPDATGTRRHQEIPGVRSPEFPFASTPSKSVPSSRKRRDLRLYSSVNPSRKTSP